MVDSTDYNAWLKRARQDLKIIDMIVKQGVEGLEDSLCYLCQQSIEKLLKAFLLFKQGKIQKTHELRFLLGQCAEYESSLALLGEDVTILDAYATSARYPVDFGGGRTPEEAWEAQNITRKIFSVLEVYFS